MATELTKDRLLEAYRTMRTIREFEDRIHADFSTGEIPGFVHLYAGEEASATGIIMHLSKADYIASTHRGHGHCIAKGVDVMSMMAEIWGTTPEAIVFFKKISEYPPSETTPSWMRAPPESLRPITGAPVFMAMSMILQILAA